MASHATLLRTLMHILSTLVSQELEFDIKITFCMTLELLLHLRAFIGVETAALTFRIKQYSTSYSSHICYGKRFHNDFFLNHNTTALVHNCLKLLSCVVIETALDGMKIDQLS